MPDDHATRVQKAMHIAQQAQAAADKGAEGKALIAQLNKAEAAAQAAKKELSGESDEE